MYPGVTGVVGGGGIGGSDVCLFVHDQIEEASATIAKIVIPRISFLFIGAVYNQNDMSAMPERGGYITKQRSRGFAPKI